MRRGLFPGQEAALREELRRQERSRTTRRALLGAFAGCVVGGVAGFSARSLVGAPSDPGVPKGPSERLDSERLDESVGPGLPSLRWANDMASAPLDQLLEAHRRYLLVALQAQRPTERVWLGISRIVHAAIEGDPRLGAGVGRGLLKLRDRRPPQQVELLLDLLEQRSR